VPVVTEPMSVAVAAMVTVMAVSASAAIPAASATCESFG
jgi:hypothetical protein